MGIGRFQALAAIVAVSFAVCPVTARPLTGTASRALVEPLGVKPRHAICPQQGDLFLSWNT